MVVSINLLMEKNELLYAGVLSSGIGFLLQAYSQQNLSPAPVAIIFSLEGVFAAVFGWILLSQFLSGIKIFGIILHEIDRELDFFPLINLYSLPIFGPEIIEK